MKIGQLASFIDTEFLPPEYRELYQEKLSHAARPRRRRCRGRRCARCSSDEWDEPVEELFEDFEQEAAAAASIGQVHRATLPDGARGGGEDPVPGRRRRDRADMQNAGHDPAHGEGDRARARRQAPRPTS